MQSLIAAVIVGTILSSIPAPSVQYAKIAEAKSKEVQIEVAIDWTPERIRQQVEKEAAAYGVSFEQMWTTMKCENPDLDPELQSRIVKNGVREDSWGLAQIHLPSNPDVTKKQAQDPLFAIEFMAKGFAAGNQERWTCYRMHY